MVKCGVWIVMVIVDIDTMHVESVVPNARVAWCDSLVSDLLHSLEFVTDCTAFGQYPVSKNV